MLVGRQRRAEVHRLEDAYDRVRSTSEPHLVVSVAPAGWGKTRIVQEFYRVLACRQPQPAYWPLTLVPAGQAPTGAVALAAERKTVRHREVLVPPGASIPWLWLAPISGRMGDGTPAPVLDNLTNQISRHLPHLVTRLRRRRRLTKAAVRTIVAALPLPDLIQLAENAVEIGETLIEAHTEWRRERHASGTERRVTYADDIDRGAQAYGMLRTLVEPGAGEDPLPVILVLDDAHNLDAAAVSLLANVLSSDLPVLTIATTWPEKVDTPDEPFGRYLADATSSERITTVQLERLTTDDLFDYVNAQYPKTDPQVAVRLAQRAGGNPYALRLLLGVPRVHGATRGGRIALPADEIDEINGGLGSLLAQHWHELAPGVRQVLAAAALLGESFLDEVVVAGLGRIQPAEGLGAALASAWIRAIPGTPGGLEFAERLRFDIARDTVRDVLSPGQRASFRAGALVAVRALLGDDLRPDLRRMLLTLHVTLAKAGVETDLAASAASAADLGEQARAEHRRIDAIDYLQQAVRWYQEAGPAGHARDTVQYLIDLAAAVRLEHGRAEGEPTALWAVETADSTLAADDELRIRARCTLASCRRRREDAAAYTSSLGLIAEAEKMLASLPHPSPATVQHVMSVKAGIAGSMGDYPRALAITRTVLAHCENSFGRWHPYTLSALESLGFYSVRVGRVDDAVHARRQVLARRTELIGSRGYLQTVAARNNLAFTLVIAGDVEQLAEAEQLIADAYAAWSRAYGRDGVRTQRAVLAGSLLGQRQGLAAERRGALAAADRLFHGAAEAAGRVVELRAHQPPLSLAKALQRYGTALACLRDPAAIAVLERALQLRLQEAQEDRAFWSVQDCATDLRWSYRRLGRDAEAGAVTRLYRLPDEPPEVPK